MKKLVIATAIAFVSPVQASWLYCKMKPTDCTYIQGALIPFDKVQSNANAPACIASRRLLGR